MQLTLQASGNRPPLGPEGPDITAFGTPDRPDWRRPFVPAEHLPAPYGAARTASVLGHIAEALTVESLQITPPDALLN